MLRENGVEFTYREYRKEPLTEAEIRDVLSRLGVGPQAILRKRDKAYAALGLTGSESDDALIGHMANHPTLVQRPIGLHDGRAAIGRPVETLLELVS